MRVDAYSSVWEPTSIWTEHLSAAERTLAEQAFWHERGAHGSELTVVNGKAVRSLNRSQSLPHLLRCAEEAGDLPLGHFFAAETVCFLGFAGYVRQPDTPLGRAALRVLHRAMEGLRCGVQPQVVAEARLGEMIEALWDHRPDTIDPLLVRVFAEAVRLLRRARLHGPAPEVLPGSDHKLAPLGRLDMDSRGLLILSEDGVLAKAVIGPDSELDKEYFVQVRGAVTPEAIRLLRHGLELDERKLRPAKVTEVSPGRLRFVLTEGRNRQIRRMCEMVGLVVTGLKRVRSGSVPLGQLPVGQWRYLGKDERF